MPDKRYRKFAPFAPALEQFAAEHGMRCRHEDADAPQYSLHWRTGNRHECYITLAGSRDPEEVILGVHCFAPSFPQTQFAKGQRVGVFRPDPELANFRRALDQARAWAETLEDELDADGRPSLEPMLRVVQAERSGGRVHAMQSLGYMADPGAVEALIEALRDDPDGSTRGIAAQALGKIDDERVLPPLRETLERDPNQMARTFAAIALVQRGDARGLEFLTRALSESKLAKSPTATQVLPGFGQKLLVLLVRTLYNSDERMAVLAAEALGKARYQAVDMLIRGLDHPNVRVRAAIATALGETGDARAAEPLKSFLDDPATLVRDAARQALSRLGEPEE